MSPRAVSLADPRAVSLAGAAARADLWKELP